ncbi:hypothetical protein [Laspinema olomoucense]|uniref:Uncharacterized protein n=1 Tax=Laspinema olomoucense D3b TaxID=2953688 RepID=A0ABT2NE00_9CYAN|nr:hypothetical protein [Laspinema sp. D3b]MCT7980917.1 hypothetical protein [Laspinema sp. D3b]
MGFKKTRYRVKSTGQLVIEKGCDIKLTSSQIKGNIVYELLDDNGYGTGEMKSFSPDDLEIFG